MSNQIHELSNGDLDEVSGGMRNVSTTPTHRSTGPTLPIDPDPGPTVAVFGPTTF
jgi:hypothetical protein